MKDYITTIASVFILMIFVMQFAAGQGTSHRVLQADMAVASFRETVKLQGCITGENMQALRRILAEICGCSPEEIHIEGSTAGSEPAIRGTLISYRITYPLKNIVAMAGMLGIREGDNQVYFNQEGWVVSFYEEPDHNDGSHEPDDNGDSV